MFNREEDNFRRKWEDEYEFKVWSMEYGSCSSYL